MSCFFSAGITVSLHRRVDGLSKRSDSLRYETTCLQNSTLRIVYDPITLRKFNYFIVC
jgi:hypothetical protein